MTQSHPKPHLGAQGAPKGPPGIPRKPKGAQSDAKESSLGAQGAQKGLSGIQREPKGSQSDPKESPLGAQGAPTGPTGIPREAKGGPKWSQGNQNESQRRPKESNKSQNYIHINKIYANSRSTAIQRPASNKYTGSPGLDIESSKL